ncbi:ABC transporter ATP-binding protein/permease [Nocardia sp. GCM10030253]|uniref:ABC transporter ATP-binding protein/permease n=1 Tax=Nocardia sp. GCM10030253 TaxID=3273404 RepID=UPI00363D2E31
MARPPVDPRLWRHARSARRYLTLSVVLSLVITVSIVVTAVALARVLAGVVTDPGLRTLGAWATELAVIVCAIGCRVVATWVQSRLAHRAGATVVAELETAVLATGARMTPRELETRRTELAVVVSTGLTGLRGYLVGYLPALLLACLVPPVVLAVIAVHDPISGVIAVITLPLIPVFMILIGLLTQGRAEATLAATTRLSDQLLDLFAGMPTLRALGRERGAGEFSVGAAGSGNGAAGSGNGAAGSRDSAPGSGDGASGFDARVAVADKAAGSGGIRRSSMEHRVRELGDALRQRTMRALRIAFLSSMVLEMLATLSVALIAVSIGLRLVYGGMGLYAGLVALILAPEVYLPLRMVGERFHAAQDGMAAADKAFAVLEPDSVAAEPGLPGSGEVDQRRVSRGDGGDFAGVIEIRDLRVRARDGFAPAGLSAVLRPNAVTVLAGPNGSGKTTALQVILGLVTPDHGMVTVDGTDVRELDEDRWWSHVAWLPQRPVLVPGTLRENLELLGARAADKSSMGAARVVDELEAACIATGFDAVLAELPHGWDTVVGTGGVGLSLGQRQRLALTRVLAADRAVLLLDEPTAHLDHHSEAAVLAALKQRASAGATVVIIGHRPSVLAAADSIVPVHATTAELTTSVEGAGR